MPAYFETGFSVRQPMWHGQGDVLDDYPTDWADARKKAGLLWEPMEAPSWVKVNVGDLKCKGCGAEFAYGRTAHEPLCLVNETGIVTLRDCTGAEGETHLSRPWAFIEDTAHKQILRSDTGAVLGAGLSPGYNVMYHGKEAAGEDGASMEQILEAFTNADGTVKFETAGSVQGGRSVWALIYLDEPYRINGDDSETIPFIALLNRHDGKGAATVVRTQVRVVCWNTYQMALAEGQRSGLAYSFRHSGSMSQRIEEAKLALSGLRDEAAEYVEMCNELSRLRISSRGVDHFLTEFLPNPAERGLPTTQRVQNNIEKARERFSSIYYTSSTTDGIRGTAYGLFQSATEYLDHERGFRTRDSYMGRSILSADAAKGKVLDLIGQAAAI